MRKILLSVCAVLMLIVTIMIIINGAQIINIYGYKGIGQKNNELESKILEFSDLINKTYNTTLSNLKNATNSLLKSKTEYENQAALSNLNSHSYAANLESYDIDYLWTKLGNYAKDESVVIKIEVTSSSASSNLYNLNFTATGTYRGITDFIYRIENDSNLGFKIDNFSMKAYTDNGAETLATFVCQDIPIDLVNIETDAKENKSDNTENTTNTNANSTTNQTSNSSKQTNTTNTTNSSKNTNTAN